MPLLAVTTNQPIPDNTRTEILRTLSATVAQILGKPEQYVMINLQTNPDMLFAGSAEPLAYLELKSIGLPHDLTKELSGKLANAIEKSLGVTQSRIYVEFADAERHLWGWNGDTFG